MGKILNGEGGLIKLETFQDVTGTIIISKS